MRKSVWQVLHDTVIHLAKYENNFSRVIFSSAILLYLSHLSNIHGEDAIPRSALLVTQLIVLFSVVMFATASSWPRKVSNVLQWVVLATDLFFCTFVIIATTHTYSYGGFLFGGFLWISISNCMKSNLLFAFISYVGCLTGMVIIIFTGEYWMENIQIPAGMLLTLAVVPLYVLRLSIKLRYTVEKVSAANKVKSQFLTRISHEMRTPLNGLISISGLLKSTTLDEEQAELVNNLVSTSYYLRRMIDDILDFSRIESGKLVSLNGNFELHDLAKNVTEIFFSRANKKKLNVSLKISPDTPFELHGDAPHLHHILINLIGNAIKFTDFGGIQLCISTVRQDEKSARIRFEIIDTGIGMESADITGMFEAFSNISSTSVAQRFRGGAGLGIAIARHLVDLLGGKIGVSSQVGNGSTFWFELPFDKPRPQHAVPSVTALEQMMIIGAGIPVADRSILENHLASWGVQHEHVETLHELLNRLTQMPTTDRHVAVVCTPSNLGLSAREFANQVRHIDIDGQISLILLSPGIHSEAYGKFKEMGYVAIIPSVSGKTPLFNALHRTLKWIQSQDSQSHCNPIESKSRRILLVEAQNISQHTFNILRNCGHLVSFAHDGGEALHMVKHNEYDLIIVDREVPPTGGIPVIRMLRALNNGISKIPVIYLTDLSTRESVREYESSGADAFLVKPIDAVILNTTIERLTAPRAPSASAPNQ